ncbi:hypothetical protein CEXT_360191 [Caerostris extrusa]|uniref:Uncharacterized protein n=1 Tax=Caerostris extrusa TaxID=172846 RepID=A0AAV4UJ66_CAEEX|nr:hypothetical protein CEXT_360191 [Caerostris extrusa]
MVNMGWWQSSGIFNSIDTESCEVEGIHSLAAWKCEAEDEKDCANGLAEQKTLLTRFKLLFGRTVDSLRRDICAEKSAHSVRLLIASERDEDSGN